MCYEVIKILEILSKQTKGIGTKSYPSGEFSPFFQGLNRFFRGFFEKIFSGNECENAFFIQITDF